MEVNLAEKDRALWQQLREKWEAFNNANAAYIRAKQAFMSAEGKRTALLHDAIANNKNDVFARLLSIDMLKHLNIDELKELFPDLIYLASWAHSRIEDVFEIILSMPREWVLTHIQNAVEPYLLEGAEEEEYDGYSAILELYYRLDHGLARQLALRVLSHPDESIREAGERYFALLEGD